jgi:hypothetical protein
MKIAMRRFSRSGIIALLTVIAFLTSLGICPRTFPAAETGVNAGEPAETENQSAVSLDVEDQQFRELDEAEENLVAEAIAAVEETRNALQSLEDNNRKAALAALEKTTGKLELLLARRPGLGLMPISASAATYDIVADVRSVKGARAEAEYLLKKGYIQAARRILETLVSEIRITRVNLPLGTYPQAVKTAARLVDEGKLQEAETVLLAALNTLVITEQSIPIPILNTQYLLDSAAELLRAEEEDEGEKPAVERKDRVLVLLDRAREELELAEELGYGRRDREFVGLARQLDRIEEEIAEDQEAGGLLDELIENLQRFKEKIIR